MERRDFLKRVGLVGAAVAVVPITLVNLKASKPKPSLPGMFKHLPTETWNKVERNPSHVSENNIWMWSQRYVKEGMWDKNTRPNRKQYSVIVRDPKYVYEYTTPTYGLGEGGKYNKIDGYRSRWMNVEDLPFYKELEEEDVFDYDKTNISAIALVPGLQDPLNPGRGGVITSYPVDGYSIHVLYQSAFITMIGPNGVKMTVKYDPKLDSVISGYTYG